MKRAVTSETRTGLFVDTYLQSLSVEAQSHLPKVDSVKKDVQRHKRQKTEKSEYDDLDLPQTLYDLVVPEFLTKNLLWDSGNDDPDRFLKFDVTSTDTKVFSD